MINSFTRNIEHMMDADSATTLSASLVELQNQIQYWPAFVGMFLDQMMVIVRLFGG